jgi:hypothetical protein
MSFARLILTAVIVLISVPASAQPENDWADLSHEYVSWPDFFRVTFTNAGKPTVTQTTWVSSDGIVYPARIYTLAKGPEIDTITVVDYTDAERLRDERNKACKASGLDGRCGQAFHYDVRAATDYATLKLLERRKNLTYIAWAGQDRVEGRALRFVNADRSVTNAAIHMHENRLYIMETTTPEGAAEVQIMLQGLQFLDKEGNLVRYDSIYSNGFPPPARIEQEDNKAFRARNPMPKP